MMSIQTGRSWNLVRHLAIAVSALVAAAICVAGESETVADARPGAVAPGCGQPVRIGLPMCRLLLQVDGHLAPIAGKEPVGLTPADIRAAYNLGKARGRGRTVAVVTGAAGPDPEADLQVYRSKFGLPPCMRRNGCFRAVDLSRPGEFRGSADFPLNNWPVETSLDVDMVSATCPDCKILLVTAGFSEGAFGRAVNYAAAQPGVAAISNSYGFLDLPGLTTGSAETDYSRTDYDHPGIAVVAAAGDFGYGTFAPAEYRTVIAVGGTSLRRDPGSPRGWSETAWMGTGSGCQPAVDRPHWQTAETRCPGRALADVSAVADPMTPVAVYDGFHGGWLRAGGTSAATPIIASVYAMSGRGTRYPAEWTWKHRHGLNNVVSGANGMCAPASWCTAGPGWNGPTGLGTPNGTAAF